MKPYAIMCTGDAIFIRRSYLHNSHEHPSFALSQQTISDKFWNLLSSLKRSAPFFSPRYQGHMNSDLVIPGTAGYLAAMLDNPTNVAFEGSPATTLLEMEAANQLTDLVGFSNTSSGGHLTSNGTVSNIEAIWCASQLRFFGFAIRRACENEPKLRRLKSLIVQTCDAVINH